MTAVRVEMSVLLLFGLTALILGCKDQGTKPRPFTMLHRAASEGDLNEVKRWVAEGLDVHAIDNHGRTPLCFAASNGNMAIAEVLIAHGADANDGSLAYAVAAKQRAMAEFLLARHARPGGSPLVQTAMDGDADLARLLIDKGADVNAKGVDVIHGRPGIDDCGKNDYGETPLGVACERGRVELVKLLLEHNANVNLKSRYGYPLQIAAEMGRKEIVELLLARGAKTDAKNTAGKTAANLADGNGHKNIGDIIRGAEHKSKS